MLSKVSWKPNLIEDHSSV